MLDPASIPQVSQDELVTRFLMSSKWYRADQTIKHEAFIPPNNLEYSVTRLLQATDAEIWKVGVDVANESKRSLHGRVDVSVSAFASQNLVVDSDPLANNPNHAKVTGWPQDKAQQMIVAKQLAAVHGLRRIGPPEDLPL